MSAANFGPGDLVRCIVNIENEFTAGQEYTVENSNGVYVNVEADDNGDPNGSFARNFELAARWHVADCDAPEAGRRRHPIHTLEEAA